MLFFAAIMLVFGLYVGFSSADWTGAALWLSIAVFFGCFGSMTLNLVPRLQRFVLVFGLFAGVIAFILALRMTLGM